MVDPKTSLDPILLGWKTENKTKTYVKCSKSTCNNTKHPKRGLRKIHSASDSPRSFVWEDVVRKDELRWDLTDHPKH